jgi:hypothetical protein
LEVTDVRVDTRGLTSGNVLTGDKALWGPSIGVAAEWVPAARIPLGLEVEAGIGFLMPVIHDEVEDGYTPFDGGLAVDACASASRGSHGRADMFRRGRQMIHP